MPDIDKYLQVAKDYGENYIDWFLSFFSQPELLSSGRYRWARTPASARSKVPAFLVFSVLIGATIGSAIRDRPPLKERAVVAVTVLALWIFTSVLVYGLCRLMRGAGSLKLTVTTMLQVLAVAYVTSNFLTFLTMSAASVFPAFKRTLDALPFDSPGNVLLSIQFVILAIYTPWALTSVHGFRRVAGAVIGLVAATLAISFGLLVFAEGSC